jgi:mannose-6-phosphate isomerase-like protein (cupin superfamily)
MSFLPRAGRQMHDADETRTKGRTYMTADGDRTGFEFEQEALWYLGGLRIINALRERIGEALHLTEFVSPARTHMYALRREEEALYALEGEATVVCAGRVFPVSAGSFVFLPGDVPYQMQVSTFGPFHYLEWLTPPGFAHDVTWMGDPSHALVLNPPLVADRAKVERLAELLRAGPG